MVSLFPSGVMLRCGLTLCRRFSGDESFLPKDGKAPALDAGSGLGVVVEGKKKTDDASGSRL
jgi:hypothetical protein